jgi:hypothetical protein
MARRALGVAAALLAATATTASGAVRPSGDVAPLPIGTDTHGVLARVVGSDAVFTFKPAAAGRYRRIAGHTVEAGCVALVRTTRSGAATEKIWAGRRLLASQRRSPLRVFIGERGGKPDYCAVLLIRPRGTPLEVAAVPVSAKGARYLDERTTVRTLLGLLLLTSGPSGHPTPASSMQAVTHGEVVPVAGAEQPPPAGHVGYWTDGANVVYLGALTHSGVLFFYQYDISTNIVTTNVLDWLNGQDDP